MARRRCCCSRRCGCGRRRWRGTTTSGWRTRRWGGSRRPRPASGRRCGSTPATWRRTTIWGAFIRSRGVWRRRWPATRRRCGWTRSRPPRATTARWRCCRTGITAEGWQEYEWRWKRKQAVKRAFRQPRWDGEDLAGKTILLWCEQGLGDAIQFVRDAPLVKAKGGQVVLECPGFMIPLFSTCAALMHWRGKGRRRRSSTYRHR